MENTIAEFKKVFVHLIKEKILLFRYYGLRTSKNAKKKTVIAIFDGRRGGMGLTDRLKGIISLFAYSKATGRSFKCDFTYPFQLNTFFTSNTYDWEVSNGERSQSIFDTRVLILHGEPVTRLLSLKTKKQIHSYINRDYLDEINGCYNQTYKWGDLFNELFKLTPFLSDRLKYFLDEIGLPYIACQLRFMSLLGDFKEYDRIPLPKNEQKSLIKRCTEAILRLKETENKPVLVVSDSITFVTQMSDYDGIKVFPERTVHIDCVDEENKELYSKPFIDFLLLSKAEKVYNIVAGDMYPSDFPLYASKINDIPFERVIL